MTDDFILDLDLDLDLDLSFDLDDKPKQSNNRYCLPKIHSKVKAQRVKYEHAEQLVKETSDAILNGETVHALLSGNFIFGDFFEAFAVVNDIYIDSIQLSTLSIGQENVDSFKNMFDGDYLGGLDIIVSDYFWSHNRHNAPYIYKQLDHNDQFQLAVAGTHTKIALVKIGDKKIVTSGSANLRSSRCVEEVTIQTCSELYDFHHAWQAEILEQYATIKKAMRGGVLFDAITKGVEEKKTWQDQK